MFIITGTVAYDYIMDFPGNFGDHILPDQIHKVNLSFIVNKFARRRGGTAGNVSYSLGLLTTPHVLYSVAGKDFAEYKKEFKKLKISLDHVIIDKATYTATGFAMTDHNNNQIWGYFYGAADGIKDLPLQTVASKNDLVLIGPSGAEGSMHFVKECVRLGIRYMFDPGFILTQVSDEDLRIGVQHARYIIGNDYEIDLIHKRTGLSLSGSVDQTIITTLGEKGATINDKGTEYSIKPINPEKVVDPTGAGDAWRSGFLAGLERQFDIRTCGQMGTLAATYAIEHYGTQEHKYSKAHFENRYRQNYGSLIEL